MKWLTTYKREVERTEQLGIEYQTALDNIITEIKKDDNLSPDRILDIVECIKYIKRNRKRWVAGTSQLYGDSKATSRDTEKKFFIQLPQLRFKPSLIVLYHLSGTPCLYTARGDDIQMLDTIRDKICNVVSVVTGGKNIYFRCGIHGDIGMGDYRGNYLDVNSYKAGPITFLCVENMVGNASFLESRSAINWIAFD